MLPPRPRIIDEALARKDLNMSRLLAAALLVVAPIAALANVVVESVSGEVTANSAPVYQGQPMLAEQNIITGSGGRVVLRFGDGMQVAVDENSRFRLVDFRYNKGPSDRAVFDLL